MNETEIMEKSIKTIKDFVKKDEEKWKETGYKVCDIDLIVSFTNLIFFYENSTKNIKEELIDF